MHWRIVGGARLSHTREESHDYIQGVRNVLQEKCLEVHLGKCQTTTGGERGAFQKQEAAGLPREECPTASAHGGGDQEEEG